MLTDLIDVALGLLKILGTVILNFYWS